MTVDREQVQRIHIAVVAAAVGSDRRSRIVAAAGVVELRIEIARIVVVQRIVAAAAGRTFVGSRSDCVAGTRWSLCRGTTSPIPTGRSSRIQSSGKRFIFELRLKIFPP